MAKHLGAFTRKDVDPDTEVEALMQRFPRLRERIDMSVGVHSDGGQQMLAVARGQVAKPRMILLDEPSLGLAPAMVRKPFDTLADHRDEGVTILWVDQMATEASDFRKRLCAREWRGRKDMQFRGAAKRYR